MFKKILCVALACLLIASCTGCITINRTAPAATNASTDAPSAVPTAAPTDAVTVPATIAQPTPTEAPTMPRQDWETASAGSLYRPSSSYFVDQYTAYVFCTDVDVQDYVKMRFGPSKSHFNTVGVQIDNYSEVTVETTSVNGWRLCYYNGTEGWIRSDFIFNSIADIDRYLGVGQPSANVVTVPCYGLYYVYVDDQYAGEPLNMRSGPGRSYDLIKKLPDGTLFLVGEEMPVIDGWVYGDEVKWLDDGSLATVSSGYVLFKYLRMDGSGDKPVLYLYPEKTETVDVRVTLSPAVRFSCTYPEYKNGWRVSAAPDGTLTNLADGRQYNYLYWELEGVAAYDFSEGFVVKGADAAAFLEKTLDEIGLTPREANEFIVYWLPQLQKNAYNLISFQAEAYTNLVKLDITPAPDSVLRVFMAYKVIDAPVLIPAQHFDPFVRNGFTAVEWGGAKVR